MFGHVALSSALKSSPLSSPLCGVASLGLANLWGRGEKLEVGLERGLKRLELASLSLLMPIHSLNVGSGLTTFLSRRNMHLGHLNSDLQWVTGGCSLSLWPHPSLNVSTEASCSWLRSKYCFQGLEGLQGLQELPGSHVQKWNPAMESAGKG